MGFVALTGDLVGFEGLNGGRVHRVARIVGLIVGLIGCLGVGRTVTLMGGLVHRVGPTLERVGRTVGNGGRTGGLVHRVGLIFGLVGSNLVGTLDQIRNFRVVRTAGGLVGLAVGLRVSGGFGILLVVCLVMGRLLVGLGGGIVGLLMGGALGGLTNRGDVGLNGRIVSLGNGGFGLGGGGLAIGLGGDGGNGALGSEYAGVPWI